MSRRFLDRRPNAASSREKNRTLIAVHAGFWVAVFGFFVFYFGRGDGSFRQSLIFVTLLLPVTMATTYTVTYVLIPRFLLQRRFGKFAIYGLYTLVGSVYLELLVVLAAYIFLAQYEIEAMNPATLDIVGLIVGTYVVVFLAVSANLGLRWHRLRERNLQAELTLRQAELDRLKTQIRPHVLFNTLNNLYGLVLEQSEKAPDVVLQLADLLEYMLYRADDTFVPLNAEIEHIRTYLDIERLRVEERVSITFDVDPVPTGARIAPLLLIPLVENAFKHGVRRRSGASWVRLNLRVREEQMFFSVENSRLPDDDDEQDPSISGIGLPNLRKRLQLLYPSAHDLDLTRDETTFTARLALPLHPPAPQASHDSNPDRRRRTHRHLGPAEPSGAPE
ncbi:sensor histidine kinase [Longibacter salinarum]|nr:histidine kinase [Longibacter salinarum]